MAFFRPLFFFFWGGSFDGTTVLCLYFLYFPIYPFSFGRLPLSGAPPAFSLPRRSLLPFSFPLYPFAFGRLSSLGAPPVFLRRVDLEMRQTFLLPRS